MNTDGRDNIIKIKTFKFAVRIVRLYQYLCKEKNEYILSKQILKSGTSVGANVEEKPEEEFLKLIFHIKFLFHIKRQKKLIIG